MTDLILRKTNRLLMSGGSSVKSVSKPSGFALLMQLGGSISVSTSVKSVNTIVIEPVLFTNTGYDSISTNICIGTSIQSHGPPMVDNRTFLHSFTVFTVYSDTYQINIQKKMNKIIRRCG